MNPIKKGVEVRQRVCYVSENYGFYEWMKVDELIALVAAYHKTWSWTNCKAMQADFKLRADQKIKELSKGMKAKLSLLLALSFDPEILVLDEPTDGLDPAARRNFIEIILSKYEESGKTILVSSHLLNEFSGLIDHVAFILDGKLEMTSRVDELHQKMKRARLIFQDKVPAGLKYGESLAMRVNGREAVVTCTNFSEEKTIQDLQKIGAEKVIIEDLTLEDIFVDMVGS